MNSPRQKRELRMILVAPVNIRTVDTEGGTPRAGESDDPGDIGFPVPKPPGVSPLV